MTLSRLSPLLSLLSCGHLYHASCLGVDTVDPGHMSHSCIVCHKTSAPLPGRGRTHTTSVSPNTHTLSLSRPLCILSLSLSLSNTHTLTHTHIHTHPMAGTSQRKKFHYPEISKQTHSFINIITSLSLSHTHTHTHTHTHSHTTQVRDQVGLDPVQRENLRKLTMSYKSNPNEVHSHTLTKPISTL